MAGLDPAERRTDPTQPEAPGSSWLWKRHGWLLGAPLLVLVLGGGLWVAGGRWYNRTGSGVEGLEPVAPRVGPDLPLKREAFELADRVLREFPNAPDALYIRGMLLDRWGEHVEAAKCWEACLRAEPRYVAAYEALGSEALKRGQYEKAASLMSRALELNPELPEAPLRLAEALMGLGQIDQAASVLQGHLARYPYSTEGHSRLGDAYMQLQAFEKAKACYEKVLELQPDCIPAHYGIAAACERLGEREKARQYRAEFEKLKRAFKQDEKKRRKAHNDQAWLRRLLAEDYMAVGGIYSTRGRAEEALECLRKAAAADPTHAESRQTLVTVLLWRGRTREALEVLQELRQIEPHDPVHLVNLGTLHLRLRQLDEAERAFKAAVKLAPDRSEGYASLAQFYLQTRRNLPLAKQHAAKAVELEPTGQHYFILCLACRENADPAGAITAIDRAIQIDPGNRQYREARERLQQKRK
ncbi:MAG: tetratricopeptide repeat protein [Thermoguttaceae bacterium]